MSDAEAVNHPNHYGGDTVYEVVKVCEAWGFDKDTYLFQTVRYVARAGKKDPTKEIEDLEKGLWYLQRKIDNLKKEQARDVETQPAEQQASAISRSPSSVYVPPSGI
jgi:hypothetical protein